MKTTTTTTTITSVVNDNQQHIPKMNINLQQKFNKYEQFRIRQATAAIANNVGFTTASNSSLSLLSSLVRTYFEQLCRDSTDFAQHAGSELVTLEDASKVFEQNSINLSELHDYLHQIEDFSLQEQTPLFPIPVSTLGQNVTDVVVPQPELDPSKAEGLKDGQAKGPGEEKNREEEKPTDEAEDNNTDQKTNPRIVQKAFPKFFDAFAQELGFVVQKVVPPTKEVNSDCHLARGTEHSAEASFTIVRQEHVIGPTLSIRAIPFDERHKEKKRKKKKKEKREREQQGKGEEEGGERKRHKQKLKKHRKNEGDKEKAAQKVEEPSIAEQPLKVPKIKIRFGLGPSASETEMAPPLPLEEAAELALPSISSAAHSKPEEVQPTQENAFGARPLSSPTPQEKSTKTVEMTARSSPLIPPLRIMKSPPKKAIVAVPVSASPPEVVPVKATTVDEPNEPKLPPQLVDEPAEPIHIQPQEVPVLEERPSIPEKQQPSKSSSGKKRSRKSEKPTRVDPLLSSLPSPGSSPPGIQPIRSQALESVLSKPVEPAKKLSEPPMTGAESKMMEKSGRSSAQARIAPVESARKKEKTKMKPSSGGGRAAAPPPNTASTALAASQGGAEEEPEEDIWICPVCSVAYVEHGPDMVACDGCDRWFHWRCVGILISPPEDAPWFCSECKKRRKKQQQGNGNGSGSNSRKSSLGAPPSKKKRPSK